MLWWLGFISWYLIGCAVFAFIDDEQHSLFAWVTECPIWLGYELTIMCWPVVTYYWFSQKE